MLLAPALGLEPRYTVLETVVLPLNEADILEKRIRFELTNNRVAACPLKPLGYRLIGNKKTVMNTLFITGKGEESYIVIMCDSHLIRH